MNDVKILVCCHKECALPINKIFLPIQVGSSLNSNNINIQRDDTVNFIPCDNISFANNIYCEMTGMYWAWKNITRIYPDIKYIGLCHYRRYFNANISPINSIRDYYRYSIRKIKEICKVFLGKKLHISYYESQTTVSNLKMIEGNSKQLYSIITQYEIIYTKPIILINSNVETMFEIIGRSFILLLREIVKEKFADYYDSLEMVLSGNKLATANMVILNIKYFDEYCNFIFSILDTHIKKTVERNICSNPYKEKIYSRVSGYLSEILTYTYIVKKEKENVHTIKISKYFIDV